MVDNTGDAAILAQLMAREPLTHRRAFGTSRADLEALLAPDFHEIGASGRRYGRNRVIETCLARYAAGPEPHDWPCRDARLTRLSDDLFLVTYQLFEPPDRVSMRATLWQRKGTAWQIRYHQGTLVKDTEDHFAPRPSGPETAGTSE